ncbi:MAG: ABC transporter ATP-binding protein/permease [Treponema sp.]|jgi:ATP-binding cassette subfamily B protein|nr:ABC transporter ATP-binding protein/permease [Treponema sp.]
MSSPKRPAISFKEYRSLLPWFSRYRWHYLWGLLCLVVVDGAQTVIPQFVRRAVDIISAGNFTVRQLLIPCLGMIAVMTLISLGRFLWRYFIYGASRRIETELRERLFDHLLTLSWDFYQRNKTGDLMARSINDLGAVKTAIGMGLVAMVDFIVMATTILVIIFVQDARTAALAILPLPLITVLVLVFGSMVGRRFLKAQEIYSVMSDTVQETFAGVRVVKSFVKEWWFIRRFAGTNDDYRKINMELAGIFGFFFPLVSFLSGLTMVILILVGGVRVVRGEMSAGDLVALFEYLQMLIWPLMGAGFTVNMIQRGAVSLGRVNEILNTKPAILSPAEPRRPPVIPGTASAAPSVPETAAAPVPALELRHLTFSYGASPPSLEDVSLTVAQGEWLGIMGRTGSGKSTLIKTLTRTVDPPPGTVRVFGLEVHEWDLAGLRSCFAAAPQDSYLFSDYIRGNIGYGLEEAGEEIIKRGIAVSALERDLENFSEGWDTLIGERGLTLSGGQKQRVAVSRAVIMDSPVLVLDDSLSAVDAETEQRILSALIRRREEKLKEGRTQTVIFISHRVSTLCRADRVAVLEGGRIAEYGSPETLGASGGYFARTAALQRLEQDHG